ncbi:hypothetical protein ACFLW4_06900 [Chloroflexota bacterium]
MKGLNKITKILVTGAGLLVLTSGAFLLGCQTAGDTQTRASAGDACPVPQEIETMNLPENSVATKTATIPPIDASAPAKTETATFALG